MFTLSQIMHKASLLTCFTDCILFGSRLGHSMALPTVFIHQTWRFMFLNQLS